MLAHPSFRASTILIVFMNNGGPHALEPQSKPLLDSVHKNYYVSEIIRDKVI